MMPCFSTPHSPRLRPGVFHRNPIRTPPMDKKAKKRIDLLHQRLTKLRQQLAGARQQPDDPGEPQRLEKEIAAAEAELAKIKQEG